MRIACLGGGPAGLHFAISAKLRNQSHDIHVFERNGAGQTGGQVPRQMDDADKAVDVARAMKDAGVDIIDVSAGETTPDERPVYGRMFQTPFADQIRNEVGIPVIAVGNIVDADQVNGIVTAGHADMVALGRPHLADPVWTLRASAIAGDNTQFVPSPYVFGQQQALRLAQSA